ncbi:mechanosensitive ion channel family protein [Sphingobacterium sp. lm-10]|uniref:mechanosensitive ion channel family protein n=1 Tax=Sphingobacterium sp. lm-10 TaxID=2944904 RepID=UPI0020224140|nr:mechanosensitive ion channel domain-containing protein [Sphingobacterium sp. lm-10]MCL7987693.1 mechanosensitive ion channel family protein [Sphingobacterium sp. lm-10]
MKDSIEQFLADEQVNTQIYNTTYQQVAQLKLNTQLTHIFTTASLLIAMAIVLFAVDYIVRNIFIRVFSKMMRLSQKNVNERLIQNKFFSNLSLLILLTITQAFLPLVFRGFPGTMSFLEATLNLIIAFVALRLVNSVLKTGRDVFKNKPGFVDKPLDSYLQVLQIVLYFIGGTILFTVITGKSPGDFLISMGAASAILMLVFKDTILGFVASIQVSANDSVRVGDWIEMKKYNADGDVLQINLNNIRIRNFDRTIVTIPTHTLLTESFTNYRGMQQSGGRRIKRAVNVKISSIRYVSDEEITQLRQIRLLKDFIDQRLDDIQTYNNEFLPDESMPVNGRRMTNIGLFRAYLSAYAKAHPRIQQSSMVMVRQLAPTEHGLPLELYMFTDGTAWSFYEEALADIFDHLFAAIKFFDLEVFEAPASDDLRKLKQSLSKEMLSN